MLCSLENKVVAVTGGFGALGSHLGLMAVEEGAKVALIARNAPKEPIRQENVLSLSGVDLTDLDAATRAMSAVAERFGRIDGLVNTAGAFQFEHLDAGVDAWERMFDLNLKTVVMSCRAVLPHLSSGGRIVNIGAVSATKAAAGMGAYAASKSGVARLTESLAEELKERGITVNAVLPLTIDTPQNRADMPKADFTKWTRPEEIAKVIVFLLSPPSAAVTGALIPVPGRG